MGEVIMANIADIIEEYIKAGLSQSNGGIIVFCRRELAERFQCVPSQINYVLSTRFSVERGYIIETRRGGGGFIRIVRVSLDKNENLFDLILDKIGARISFSEAVNIIRYLYEEDMITQREAYLMQAVMELTAPANLVEDKATQRAVVLKSMLMVLLRHQK
jgi:transcriptional regulator CtsR